MQAPRSGHSHRPTRLAHRDCLHAVEPAVRCRFRDASGRRTEASPHANARRTNIPSRVTAT